MNGDGGPPPPGGPLPHAPLAWWAPWLGPYVDLVVLLLAGVPLALLGAAALATRRQAWGTSAARAWRTALCDVGMVYGTVPFVVLTLRAGGGSGAGSAGGAAGGAVSLVPLRDLATMPAYQVLGNLLLLAAFGALAPVRFAALRPVSRVVLVAALGSLAIESVQYAWVLDRVSSVDDVLLNAGGAGLAAQVSRVVGRNFRGRCRRRPMPIDVGVKAPTDPRWTQESRSEQCRGSWDS